MRTLGAILTLFFVSSPVWSMPMLTLPSAVVSPDRDTIIPFLTPFDANVAALPAEFQNGWWVLTHLRFSNWDTRYVDIVLRSFSRDKQYLLSDIPYSSGGAPVTFVTLDVPAGMDPMAWGGNHYLVLENEPPRRYLLQFGVSGGRQPMRVSNIWTTGMNHSPMLLVIHGDAIAAAGGTYQLPFMITGMQFRNAGGQWHDAIVDVRGGTFTTVPDPGAIGALIVGIGILCMKLARRRRR